LEEISTNMLPRNFMQHEHNARHEKEDVDKHRRAHQPANRAILDPATGFFIYFIFAMMPALF